MSLQKKPETQFQAARANSCSAVCEKALLYSHTTNRLELPGSSPSSRISRRASRFRMDFKINSASLPRQVVPNAPLPTYDRLGVAEVRLGSGGSAK